MGRALSGLALLIFFIACGEKTPEGVVSNRVMPDLLFDIHLLDSRMSSMPIDSSRKAREPAYDAVFRKYGLDSAGFRRTLDYYMGRPGELQAIYKVVQERLDRKIEEEQARVDEEYRLKRQADSLVAARIRDSVFRRDNFEQRWEELKHLLHRHEADSTIDKGVPFTFEEYVRRIYKDLGGWNVDFVEDFDREQEPVVADSVLDREVR